MRRVTWAGPRTNTVVEEEEQGAFDLGGMFATLYAMPTESSNLRNLVSGGVVSVACIPGAISFSMIAGVSPLNGIWAGVFMGLYGSLLGGRPGMISCSSAATAVVLREIQVDHGVGAMGLAVVICGCLEVLAGALSLSRFIALVPHPVMLGFVNGLAIVIIRAQSQQFRQGMGGPLVEHDMLIGMIITAVVCMAGASLFPRIPRVGHLLPGPLVGIVLAIVAGQILSPWFPTRTLIDVAGQQTFAGGLASIPNWDFPPQQVKWGDSAMWGAVVITAVRMMLVGLVETLLTVKLIDQITGVEGCTRRECFGQGFGNIASGMFGTQGGCALIGESMINIGGGGHGRLSSFVMACGLATSVLLLAPVVGHIPVAALVGLMFLVALNTFAWGSFGILHIVDRLDLMVILTVTVVTILLDLASATIVGLFLSALGFAWSAAKDVRVDEETYEASTRTFVLKGALFFGSAMNFNNLIQPKCIPESHVVLDFSKGKILDHSGQEAIVKSIARLKEAGKMVKCAGLRGDAFSYVEYYHEDVLESQAAK